MVFVLTQPGQRANFVWIPVQLACAPAFYLSARLPSTHPAPRQPGSPDTTVFCVPPEPASWVSFAWPETGSVPRAVNQTWQSCIPRAWLEVDAGNQSRPISALAGQVYSSPQPTCSQVYVYPSRRATVIRRFDRLHRSRLAVTSAPLARAQHQLTDVARPTASHRLPRPRTLGRRPRVKTPSPPPPSRAGLRSLAGILGAAHRGARSLVSAAFLVSFAVLSLRIAPGPGALLCIGGGSDGQQRV